MIYGLFYDLSTEFYAEPVEEKRFVESVFVERLDHAFVVVKNQNPLRKTIINNNFDIISR